MLNFATGQKIWLAKAVTDMRKSFDTLAAMAQSQLGRDPYSGEVFIFVGTRKDRVKILVWDVSGFWVCAKRLEMGTFAVPKQLGAKDAEGRWPLSPAQVYQLLEGIDVHKATYHQHYARRD